MSVCRGSGRLVLFSLRDARTPGQLQRKLASFAELLRELLGSRDGLAALGVLMRYYQRVSKLTSVELELLIRTAAGEEVMDALKNADWFIEDAKTEGRIEGELIGERRLLRRLLTTRFGDLPLEFATRLDAATREELETWAERLLSAKTLAVVFGDA